MGLDLFVSFLLPALGRNSCAPREDAHSIANCSMDATTMCTELPVVSGPGADMVEVFPLLTAGGDGGGDAGGDRSNSKRLLAGVLETLETVMLDTYGCRLTLMAEL